MLAPRSESWSVTVTITYDCSGNEPDQSRRGHESATVGAYRDQFGPGFLLVLMGTTLLSAVGVRWRGHDR